MKILITGYNGFIGRNLLKNIFTHYPDLDIVGLDDFSTSDKNSSTVFLSKFNTLFPTYDFSILDKVKLVNLFEKEKITHIIHLAALPSVKMSVEDPLYTSEVNTLGTLHLLDSSRIYKIQRFVFASSASIYGYNSELPLKEKYTPSTLSPYASSKISSEYFLQSFSSCYPYLDTVSLRFFNIYGDYQVPGGAYGTVISSWLSGFFNNYSPHGFIEGDGSNIRDFIYIEDITNCILKAIFSKNKFKGTSINIGTGISTSISEVKNILEDLLCVKIILESRSKRLGDVEYSLADITKMKELLNYSPKFTLKEGLKSTINFWKEFSKK